MHSAVRYGVGVWWPLTRVWMFKTSAPSMLIISAPSIVYFAMHLVFLTLLWPPVLIPTAPSTTCFSSTVGRLTR
ncbi:hypothetical protein BDU57DRAFT_519812 [Ampelomyces quisqualis]|uniref:Uncharacterized protein n=1 Tax=Ampelomyces quisqualis TaxID=50730 RepID=A0A6A5QGZ2_AMPQU|nr:hypothetical protein BDU57DRAFT_519812 [Ampelomyces quisqualis]